MRPDYFLFHVLRKLRILRYFNFEATVRRREDEFNFPIMRGVGMSHFHSHEREPGVQSVMERALSCRDGCMIDVGVNVGQTLRNVCNLSSFSSYVGFEPNPHLASYLSELVSINSFSDVRILAAGLSDQTGVSEFEYSGVQDSGASTQPELRDEEFHKYSATVPVHRGDDIINSLDATPVSLIKIDIEGGELEALKGLRSIIETNQPIVICEILPIYDESTEIGSMRRDRTDKIMDFFHEREYSTARIKEDGKLEFLDYIETHSDLALTDYVACPKGMIDNFVQVDH